MAKFAIGATSIKGSISNTSMIFSQEGLELINGQLTIIHEATPIFRVDQ